ncbi:PAQR family membrane homeostasis protein TrhA, partial [Thiorhodococcus minor]
MQPIERFNSISHLVGAALALAGGAVLIILAALKGDVRAIVSTGIYVFTLVLLYLISTLYHGLSGRAKRVFRVLDHQAIYLLIAGTYTPFTLVGLKGTLGWLMFGA